MADIAAVFHWDLSTMDPLAVADLMGWRERARQRSGQAQ